LVCLASLFSLRPRKYSARQQRDGAVSSALVASRLREGSGRCSVCASACVCLCVVCVCCGWEGRWPGCLHGLRTTGIGCGVLTQRGYPFGSFASREQTLRRRGTRSTDQPLASLARPSKLPTRLATLPLCTLVRSALELMRRPRREVRTILKEKETGNNTECYVLSHAPAGVSDRSQWGYKV
ncbi:unnamed protein product, partial [Hapterophycus canaliculatus]